MKYLPKFLIFSLLLIVVGCSKGYDDSVLTVMRAGGMKIEQLCQQMNIQFPTSDEIRKHFCCTFAIGGALAVLFGKKHPKWNRRTDGNSLLLQWPCISLPIDLYANL